MRGDFSLRSGGRIPINYHMETPCRHKFRKKKAAGLMQVDEGAPWFKGDKWFCSGLFYLDACACRGCHRIRFAAEVVGAASFRLYHTL